MVLYRYRFRRLSGSLGHLYLACALAATVPQSAAAQTVAQAAASASPTNAGQSSGPTADALPDGGLRDIKALRPPPPVRWPLFVGAAALVLALLAALVWWLRRRSRRQTQVEPVPRPAHEVALAALEALHQLNFADRASVRHYYFAISEVLRAYVTARFALTATQLTTEEIFGKLPELVELTPPESVRFRAFLAETDRVKYARHEPTPEEIGAVYTQAVAFIEATARRATAPDKAPAQEPAA
jgi:hypothetical protein